RCAPLSNDFCSKLALLAPEVRQHEIAERGDLGIAVSATERRHESLAVRGLQLRTLQNDLNEVVGLRVTDRLRAEQCRRLVLTTLPVPQMAAGAGSLEQLQTEIRLRHLTCTWGIGG